MPFQEQKKESKYNNNEIISFSPPQNNITRGFISSYDKPSPQVKFTSPKGW